MAECLYEKTLIFRQFNQSYLQTIILFKFQEYVPKGWIPINVCIISYFAACRAKNAWLYGCPTFDRIVCNDSASPRIVRFWQSFWPIPHTLIQPFKQTNYYFTNIIIPFCVWSNHKCFMFFSHQSIKNTTSI